MSYSINWYPTEAISYIIQHILPIFSMDCLCLQQPFMWWKLLLFPKFHTSFFSFQCHFVQFFLKYKLSRPSFSSLPRYVISPFWSWISNFIKTLRNPKQKAAHKIKQCAFCSEIIFSNMVLIERKWEKILFWHQYDFDFEFKRISWKIITPACIHSFCLWKLRHFTQT